MRELLWVCVCVLEVEDMETSVGFCRKVCEACHHYCLEGPAVDRQHERPWERGEQALDSLVCTAGLIFARACVLVCVRVCGRDGSHPAL